MKKTAQDQSAPRRHPSSDDVRGEVRKRLTDWQALIGRQPEVSRQILRKLLVGRFVLTPKVTGGGALVRIHRPGTLLRALAPTRWRVTIPTRAGA